MSKLLKLSFLIAIIAILLTSCNQDDVLQDNNITPTPTVTNNLQQVSSLVTSDSAGCYEIVFPINFILEDGSTSEVTSDEDLNALFSAPPFPVNIGFPVNLTNSATGENVTAADEAALNAYLEQCVYEPIGGGPCDSTNFDYGFIGCYDLDFPVSFILEDGTTVTANNDDELATIFQPLNPIVDFVYPLNLTNIDTGESATANTSEELDGLLALCNPFNGGGYQGDFMFSFMGCYELDFPINFVLQDGTTATATEEEDLFTIFDINNPPVEYAYPLNMHNLITGEAATANSHEELEELLALCVPPGGGGCDTTGFETGSLGCYQFVFPTTFILADESSVTVASIDELIVVFNPTNPPVEFGYPLNLQNTDTGENVTANTAQELEELLALCDPNGGGNGGGTWGQGMVYPLTFMSVEQGPIGNVNCYSYQYPVSVVAANGETLTATDDESMLSLIFGNIEITDFVYPISVTDTDTGATLTANNESDVLVWLSECD